MFLAEVSWRLLSARCSPFLYPNPTMSRGPRGQGTAPFSLRMKLPGSVLRQNSKPSGFHSPFCSGQPEKPHNLNQILSFLGLNPPCSHGSWDQTQIPHPGVQALPWSAPLLLPPHSSRTAFVSVSGSHNSLSHLRTFALAIPPAWNSFTLIFSWLAPHPGLDVLSPDRSSLTSSLPISPCVTLLGPYPLCPSYSP